MRQKSFNYIYIHIYINLGKTIRQRHHDLRGTIWDNVKPRLLMTTNGHHQKASPHRLAPDCRMMNLYSHLRYPTRIHGHTYLSKNIRLHKRALKCSPFIASGTKEYYNHGEPELDLGRDPTACPPWPPLGSSTYAPGCPSSVSPQSCKSL